MRERTSALRPDDLQAMDGLYATIAASGRGRTMFVVGDDAAGRNTLLRDWVQGLRYRTADPYIVGGVFEVCAYAPWRPDASAASQARTALNELLASGEPAVTLTESLLPAAVSELLGQVLSKSQDALRVAGERIRASEGQECVQALCDGMRALCEERPVACVIECPDGEGGGLLADLIAAVASRVATDLPLLLIVAIDGPQRLGRHRLEEPDVLNVARQLTSPKVDAATWHWLPALTVTDLARFTGPCKPGMLELLIQIAGGLEGWSVSLWRQWRERDLVRENDDAPWQFADGQSHEAENLSEHVDARMRGLVGDRPEMVARARQLLTCAALEGRWVTAPAVALACHWDVDEAIDFFDDVVALDADHPAGLLIEEGFETVLDERGRQYHATYRFARRLDWLMLLHHGPRAGDVIYLSRRLAKALEAVYGHDLQGMTGPIGRLFAAAGDVERARRYQRMSDIGFDGRVIVWRARNALRRDTPTTPAERRRTLTLMVAASRELLHGGPFDEGLAFAQAASRLATAQADRAEIERLMANQFGHLGDLVQARAHLRAAMTICRAAGDLRGEATARHELAVMDRARGEHARAREAFTEVLEIRRKLADRRGEASARHELAVIDGLQGDLARSREGFTAALEIHRELGNRASEAAARHELAVIDGLQGSLDRARAEFTAVLRIHRLLADRHGEAAARHELAVLDQERGDHERAESELKAVIELRRELGDRHGEVVARHQLALSVGDRGEHDQARAQFTDVLEGYRELGDRHGETAARHSLAVTDQLQGDEEQARRGFTAVLELFRELGDRQGEAACRAELEALDKATSDPAPGT